MSQPTERSKQASDQQTSKSFKSASERFLETRTPKDREMFIKLLETCAEKNGSLALMRYLLQKLDTGHFMTLPLSRNDRMENGFDIVAYTMFSKDNFITGSKASMIVKTFDVDCTNDEERQLQLTRVIESIIEMQRVDEPLATSIFLLSCTATVVSIYDVQFTTPAVLPIPIAFDIQTDVGLTGLLDKLDAIENTLRQ